MYRHITRIVKDNQLNLPKTFLKTEQFFKNFPIKKHIKLTKSLQGSSAF